MGSYALATLGYYSYCRYKFNEKLKEEIIMKKALQAKILSEGTSLEEEIKEINKVIIRLEENINGF